MSVQELTQETTRIEQSCIIVDWHCDLTQNTVTVLPDQELHYFFIQGLHNNQSRIIRIELHEHSTLKVYGLVASAGEEKFRTDLVVTHLGKGSVSLVSLKGIAEGRSQIIINGIIHIKPSAQQSNARLEERVLLLSPEARAETIPNLEIQANDVRAGHAATVSKISDTELFYLQSRGIPRASAQRLIVSGFLYAQLQALPEGDLRDKIEAALSKKMQLI